MAKELKLMKGNEAIARAMIASGTDGYFGYPITPQSEVMETLMAEKPWEETGMVVLQAESEMASINMVYGGAATGKKVATSSSSPGISLMQEGLTYLAGAEIPCLVVNVMRGGPGLGTIQPSQSDYFQSVKGGGHGDYQLYTLAPASVQEMYDFVFDAWDIAFKYRNPVLILSDGAIGQCMEKLYTRDYVPRWTEEERRKNAPWGTWGKPANRPHNIITSLELDSARQEVFNHKLQAKYAEMKEKEVRYEMLNCEDADYIIVAYGSSSRIAMKAMQMARAKGIKVGLFRLITLFPFPTKQLAEVAKHVKGILCVEMSAGQMIEDVKLATNCGVKTEHFGRFGGIIPTPTEVLEARKQELLNQGYTEVYTITKVLTDAVMHYCPGCGHGTTHRLVAEVIDEMGIQDQVVGVSPVGCSVLAYNYFDVDFQEAAHGRAPALATAIKRLNPDTFVFTYQGDGDLAAIGTAETIHACNRGENITMIFVNNGIYGMTGGQMAPTTLIGMKSATTPYGRRVDLNGYPLRITELISTLPGTYYVTRQSVQTPAAVRKAKAAIRKAFENQKLKKGLSFVEILSNCNSGWKMTPVQANKWMEDNMMPNYPVGDIKVDGKLVDNVDVARLAVDHPLTVMQ